MIRSRHDPFVEAQTLQHKLQRKSRRRRKDLLALAKASAAPRRRRNDPLPRLELVSIRPDDLNLPKRKTRHCGRGLVEWFFVLTAAAYNLVRIPKILATTG